MIEKIHTGWYLLRGLPAYYRIISELETPEFKSMIENCWNFVSRNDHPIMPRKYLNYRKYIRENVAQALQLGIDQMSEARILDIGSGMGYFMFICQYYGHKVYGLDVGDEQIYNEAFSLFQFPRVLHFIQPFTPLPQIGVFDLVTILSVTFDLIDRQEDRRWGQEEWAYFFADLQKQLAPNSKIFLRLTYKFNDYPKRREHFRHIDNFQTITIGAKGVLLSYES